MPTTPFAAILVATLASTVADDMELASKLLELGRSEADKGVRLEYFKKAHLAAPSRPELVYNVGLAAEDAGVYRTAVESYRALARGGGEGPRVEGVKVRLAGILIEHAGTEAALKEAVELLSRVEFSIKGCGGVEREATAYLRLHDNEKFKVFSTRQTECDESKLLRIYSAVGQGDETFLSTENLEGVADAAELGHLSYAGGMHAAAKRLFQQAVKAENYTGAVPGAGSTFYKLYTLLVTTSEKQSLIKTAISRSVWQYENQMVSYLAPVKSTPFPSEDGLEPQLTHVRDNIHMIISEWSSLPPSTLSTTSEHLSLSHGRWSEMSLYVNGYDTATSEVFRRHFVETVQIIEKVFSRIPKGFVGFSLLKGGGLISPHCGPTNHKLRLHFGIDVPECCRQTCTDDSATPKCAIKIGDEIQQWSQADVLIIDDSFTHSVWNNCTADRVVLIVDTWHPALTQAQRDKVTRDYGFAP